MPTTVTILVDGAWRGRFREPRLVLDPRTVSPSLVDRSGTLEHAAAAAATAERNEFLDHLDLAWRPGN